MNCGTATTRIELIPLKKYPLELSVDCDAPTSAEIRPGIAFVPPHYNFLIIYINELNCPKQAISPHSRELKIYPFGPIFIVGTGSFLRR
jgi:hypothetical protein